MAQVLLLQTSADGLNIEIGEQTFAASTVETDTKLHWVSSGSSKVMAVLALPKATPGEHCYSDKVITTHKVTVGGQAGVGSGTFTYMFVGL